MEEANNPQERTVSFASQSDSVRTAQSIESKTLESATLARRPVSRLINPKPVLSSVSKTARDVSKRISLVQKQVINLGNKEVTGNNRPNPAKIVDFVTWESYAIACCLYLILY